MKKTKFLTLLALPLILGACQTKWAWWEDDNNAISRYIKMNDASQAIDSSSKNAHLPTFKEEQSTYNTYYKDYLGKFSTETDSNISQTIKATTKRYNNDYVVTNQVSDRQENFLNAKSVSSIKTDTYLMPQSDKSLIQRTITDYGYGDKVGAEATIPYISDVFYLESISIGSTRSSTNITWDLATYGFSKNDEVVIETMATSKSTYTVKFNNKTLSSFVTNTYRQYRLSPVGTAEDGSTTYVMTYSYLKMETIIGSDIFDEPLEEPYLLERMVTVTEWKQVDNGDYDPSQIPTVEVK